MSIPQENPDTRDTGFVRTRRPAAPTAGATLLCCVLALSTVATPDAVGAQRRSDLHRGMSWAAGRTEVTVEHLRGLADLDVEWIAQTPFGWQDRVDSPAIRTITSGRIMWGETDAGLRATTRAARELGIRTMLKPHIWLRERDGGLWRGDIEMKNEADWQAWFTDYRRFILHYARFAAAEGIEAFCIGTELHRAAVARPDDWRALIAEVRAVYDGQLTYAANWYREYEEIEFWDDLDAIGIQAYFPLTDATDPGIDELLSSWRSHRDRIADVQARHDKPVIFTEAGYRSWRHAAARPWEWLRRDQVEQADPALQERLYEALFRTFWHEPWFAGIYWWKWSARPPRRGLQDPDFTPHGKPAARVIRDWYGRD